MNWDDLRYVLAISRGGGLNAAARQLGVNTSSVFRRLGALEKQLEVRLFERMRTGYRLTPAGEAFAEAAGRIEQETASVERKIKGTDTRLEGHIRLNSSDVVVQYLLPEWLAEFRQKYPDLTMEIAVTADYVDLSKRDADVVIRATSSPPEHLVGRNTGPWGQAAYASKRYLDRVGRNRPLADYEWLQFEGPMRRSPMAKWIDENVDEASVKLWFDAFTTLRSALDAGLGCSVLPCFTGDGDPQLEQLPGTHNLPNSSLWVLTHPDLRRSARIHAFMEFFATRLVATRAALIGKPAARNVRPQGKARRAIPHR
jgi:DNA-binding transcriptional LysR family regulator